MLEYFLEHEHAYIPELTVLHILECSKPIGIECCILQGTHKDLCQSSCGDGASLSNLTLL